MENIILFFAYSLILVLIACIGFLYQAI